MHVPYIPESTDYWLNFYKETLASQPQHQLGGDLRGFRAFAPKHRGGGLGSFFRGLLRYAMPLLKTAGKHALITGSKIAADVTEGHTLRESANKHGRTGIANTLRETADNLGQSGKGLGSRKQYKRKRNKSKPPLSKKKSCRKVDSNFEGDIFGKK